MYVGIFLLAKFRQPDIYYEGDLKGSRINILITNIDRKVKELTKVYAKCISVKIQIRFHDYM